jgi:predicted  nucleic acid-binding Zn-ribbon protein
MENTKRGGVEKMPESGTLDKILNRIGQLDDKFSAKFEKIDDRFDKVDERFNKVDEKFDEIDERFNKSDDRFDKIDNRFDKLDVRLDMIYDQTVRLTMGQTALKTDINEIKSAFNYLNNEVARNSKDIYVIKNGQN